MPLDRRFLFIGCGRLGRALLERVHAQNLASSICIVKPTPPHEEVKGLTHTRWLTAPENIDPSFEPDLVIIAIKPQQLTAVLPFYGHYQKSVFLSVAAGTPIAKVELLLKGDASAKPCAIVRCLPNTPVAIGQGISPAFANKDVTLSQRDLCDAFLKAAGDVVWVEDEKLVDIAGALSASGPAYLFALSEAMAKAGETLGLPQDIALKLARATLIGSGALVAQSSESLEKLRAAVTSKGGVTEAALRHLLAKDGFYDLMLKALGANIARAKELSE
jgi:pyrroline-5-carboxylate reductase